MSQSMNINTEATDLSDDIHDLGTAIKYWADVQPDKTVFTFVDKHGVVSSWNPRDIYVTAGRFASRVRCCGFERGDVIANAVPNSPERLVTDFGIMMAGCVAMNCQILEKDGGDFWQSAQISRCKGLVLPARKDNSAFQLFSLYPQTQSDELSCCADIVVEKAPHLKKIFVIERQPLQDKEKDQEEMIVPGVKKNSAFLDDLLKSDADVLTTTCDPSDYAYIFTTSGSSGYCKLVGRTHQEMILLARATSYHGLNYFIDRPLGWLGGFPIDFIGHCNVRVLQDTLDGRQAVNIKDIWSLLERMKCEMVCLMPNAIAQMVEEFKISNMTYTVKAIVTGGQAIRKKIFSAVGLIADAMVHSYGSTETALLSFVLLHKASEFKDYMCGKPLEDVSIRIVDTQMNLLPAGKEGLIQVKSPRMMHSYYNHTPSSPVFTPDGWFITGDMGMLDANGDLYVYGRGADTITRDGVLIYLSWPEKIISRCPDVCDVTMIGLPQASGDEKLCACVVPQKNSGLTEDILLNFYNDQFMTSSDSEHKPSIDYVLMYDSFPLTSTGKVNKREMIAYGLQHLKLEASG